MTRLLLECTNVLSTICRLLTSLRWNVRFDSFKKYSLSYVTIFFIWHCYSILTNRCGAVFENASDNEKWARHSNVTLASGMQSQFDCHTNHVPICTFDNLWLCVLILEFGNDMWDLPFDFVIKLFKTPGKGWILCAI